MTTRNTIFKAMTFLLLCLACNGLEEISSVPSVIVTTGTVNLQSLTVTGELRTIGDGIRRHGHVWSSVNNPPTINDNASDFGERLQPGNYTSTIEIFNSNVTYVRGYAEDVHGRYFYGAAVESIQKVSANFSITNNNCSARCTVIFGNLSSRGANEFRWNFGDGSPQTNQVDASHEYTLPGTYNVTLIASGNNMLADTVVRQVVISMVTFERTYSTYGPGKQIIQLAGGGFAIAGTSRNLATGNSNVFLVITDKSGQPTAEITTPLRLSDYDEAEDMIRLSNNDLVIVGSTRNPATGGKDFLYIRTDPSGTPKVGPVRLETTTGDDTAYGVTETHDGNIVIVGQTIDPVSGSVSIHIMKKSQGLDVNYFSRTIARMGENEAAFDVTIAPDGTFLVAGNSFSDTGSNGLLLRTDINGNKLAGFPRAFDSRNYDYTYTLQRYTSETLILCGSTVNDIAAQSDIYLVKTDLNGNAISPFPLFVANGAGSERGRSLAVGADGSIVVAGAKDANAYMVKVDASGSKIWEREFGGAGPDLINAILQTDDGGYIMVGSRNNILYLIKTNHLGEI